LGEVDLEETLEEAFHLPDPSAHGTDTQSAELLRGDRVYVVEMAVDAVSRCVASVAAFLTVLLDGGRMLGSELG
jgi:hypothetical protein